MSQPAPERKTLNAAWGAAASHGPGRVCGGRAGRWYRVPARERCPRAGHGAGDGSTRTGRR